MRKNTKKGLVALTILVALVVLAVLVYVRFMPKVAASGDMKEIFVAVVHGDGTEKSFVLETKAETLGEALVEEGLIVGEEGPYGLYILSVDGEGVDEALQQWWCLTKSGEQHNQGVDGTVLTDGDCYELTFTQGW